MYKLETSASLPHNGVNSPVITPWVYLGKTDDELSISLLCRWSRTVSLEINKLTLKPDFLFLKHISQFNSGGRDLSFKLRPQFII